MIYFICICIPICVCECYVFTFGFPQRPEENENHWVVGGSGGSDKPEKGAELCFPSLQWNSKCT